MQTADHLDDEEDVEDEETALENFTTSIDNEETDEYITFRNSMQGNNEFIAPSDQALNLRVHGSVKGQGKMKFLKLGWTFKSLVKLVSIGTMTLLGSEIL